MDRVFKYYPEDFGELQVKAIHMDLIFDVFPDHTIVSSALKLRSLTELKNLGLNTKNLQILSVSCDDRECSYENQMDKNMLVISFPFPIPSQTEFVIHTKTICKPTKNILEGLYYDETPPEAPPQQITQCQQWGFQRIVPCLDDMTAKCTYNTTIIADERYTNLLTNGDVKIPCTPDGPGRVKIFYENIKTPMAPYLFFLGVGTYATFTKECEYADGKTFMLELLVPPKSERKIAEKALEILYDGVLWIHLFTGSDTYKNKEKSLEIRELIKKRDQLKKEGKTQELQQIRTELKQQISGMTLGYQYTGTVYREIGMQNSDFGGMENVGNTTITTNRIMPHNDMTDASFEYMIRVKVHEFYHNLNGSEVTGHSPFEIWLNEAVTVFIEKQYFMHYFGEEYTRLQTVLTLLSPEGGTFSEDDSAASMPIEPDGFNDPNELITGMTYVKAPEFVRMIELIIGKENYVRGLDVYHRRYKHANATRAQWIACMEEVSGKNLQHMAQGWLKKTRYPKVTVDGKYDKENKIYIIKLEQTNAKDDYWEFPIVIALVDEDGKDIQEKLTWVQDKAATITFENVPEPAFVSYNRGFSFYGRLKYRLSPERLYTQVKLDTDPINRYIAFAKLADLEKTRLLENRNEQVNPQFIDMYFSLLSDVKLMQRIGTDVLTILESTEDKRYRYAFQDLYDVKKKIFIAIAGKYKEQLLAIYHQCVREQTHDGSIEEDVKNIKLRQIKNTCLALLAKLDTPDIHDLIKKQFQEARTATEKIVAFNLYVNSTSADKLVFIDSYEQIAKQNLVSWETFLLVLAGNDSPDALSIIKRIEAHPHFRIEQANDHRALFVRFARNRKKSLLTSEGRSYLQHILDKLSQINEYGAGHVLSVFGNIDKISEEHYEDLVAVLVSVLKTLDKKKTPSIYNKIRRILRGNKKAVGAYEQKHGSLTEFLH